MSEVTIVEVRRVLWRTLGTEQGLLPQLNVTYNDGTQRVVSPDHVSLAGYSGAILPYELSDELLLIDAERDRRINSGVEYPASSGRIIQTRAQDRENIGQQMLRALVTAPAVWGDTRSWLDLSNVNPLPLPTPQDMIDLALYIGNVKERLIYKSYEIKQKRRAGIEVDWTSDAAW